MRGVISTGAVKAVLLTAMTGTVMLLPGAAHAQTKPTPPSVPILTQIALPGDEKLDCRGLSGEIGRMEEVIYHYNDAQRQAENTGTGISIAKAVGGFLIGSVPGALGVLAAGHIAGEAAGDRAQNAEDQENMAAQRRSMMIGMYNAKQCQGPIHSLNAVREAKLDKKAVKSAEQALPLLEPAAGNGKIRTDRRGYSGSAMNVRYND